MATGAGRQVAHLFSGLVVANGSAWLWAWTAFHDRPSLLGTALLAWVFGLRHAVDADHIAAIDNVVRKLMQEGRRPMTVGLFFSLGHSTVVFLGCLVIALATSMAQTQLEAVHAIGGVIGTAVSSAFLMTIALVNLWILRGVWRTFRAVRRGASLRDPQIAALLMGGGLMARLLRPAMRAVTRSWHMFPLGFLFGLGFDTATEIGLLGISATQSAAGLSPWQVLAFPALFTAGMALVDTADSVMMVGAYGWAFIHPLRKLWYNLTITAASVIVAVLIGGLEALGLIGDRFGFEGAFWNGVSRLNDDLASFGFIVIGVFVLSWAISAAIYRWKRFDEVPGSGGVGRS